MKRRTEGHALALALALALTTGAALAGEGRACVTATGNPERDARAAEIEATAKLLGPDAVGRVSGRESSSGKHHNRRLARTRGGMVPAVKRTDNTLEGEERCVTVQLQ